MIGAAERRALCYVAANPEIGLEVVADALGMPAERLAALAHSAAGQRFVRAMRGVPELLEGLEIEAPPDPPEPEAAEPPAMPQEPGPSPVKATPVDESELSDYMQSLVARAYVAIE